LGLTQNTRQWVVDFVANVGNQLGNLVQTISIKDHLLFSVYRHLFVRRFSVSHLISMNPGDACTTVVFSGGTGKPRLLRDHCAV
jgi:hypothetical protein